LFKELSDESIVSKYCESRDDRYFDVLYTRYGTKVFAKCVSILKDTQLAEDAMQDVFIKILMSLTKFQGKSKFSTWIYSITYNYCIDLIRKKKKHSVELNESLIEDEDHIEEVSDKELLEIKIERLEHLLDLAPVFDKSILMMKYMDGMSIKQIAAIFNKSESATKMSILRAKHKLKRLYKEHYHE
jgi:RNA polymerase sigma-70 factor (ECF subfamily)